MIRNRRGGAEGFMLLLLVFYIAALLLIFAVAASEFTIDEGVGLRQAATLSTYSVAEEMLLYLDTAAKFTAYDALSAVARRGGIDPLYADCGVYASYPSWTAPGDKQCFPSEAVITSTLQREFGAILRQSLLMPGLPRDLTYTLNIERKNNNIRITGITDDEISLPIIAAEGRTKRGWVKEVLLEGNLIRRSTGTFPQDPLIPVTVIPSDNRRPRVSGKPTHIVIQASDTDDRSSSITKYTQTPQGTHYIIDREGLITQLVPEDQRTSHFPECETEPCTVPSIEDVSISVTLVNTGAELEPRNTDPECNQGYRKAVPTAWCNEDLYKKPGVPCHSDTQKEYCWQVYTSKQYGNLTELLRDITKRREIPIENVMLRSQIYFTSAENTYPGPLFRQGTDTQQVWYGKFLQSLAQQTPPASQPQSTSKIERISFKVSWPGEEEKVGSCFGENLVGGTRTFFDGVYIDQPMHDNVKAFAEGTVYEICNNYRNTNRDSCHPDNTCGPDGNYIIIKHEAQLFTKYMHLSRIDVAKDDYVAEGRVIGRSGWSGCTDKEQLGFKLYLSEEDLTKPDKGRNPLCAMPQDMLEAIDVENVDNCGPQKHNGKLSHSAMARLTPEQGGCDGIDPFTSNPACSVNIVDTGAAAGTVTSTLNNLQNIPGLMSHIGIEAQKSDFDHRLIIAIIAQESGGRHDIVSATGCAGLGQLCMGTAKLYPAIFDTPFVACGNGRAGRTSAEAGCAADPRFDPFKNTEAIPLILKDKRKPFTQYSDMNLFAIAAYNGGEKTIQFAIENAKKATGNSDPSWAEVSQHLNNRVIEASLCPTFNTFCNAPAQAQKVKEIQGYVSRIVAYYGALGGSISDAFGSQRCSFDRSSYDIREYGSYTFNPSFTVEVPDLLDELGEVAKCAEKVYKECDGRNGEDTRECLQDRNTCFNQGTLKQVDCGDEGEQLVSSFEQFKADCRNNKQDNCVCKWETPSKLDSTYHFKMYGINPHTERRYTNPRGADVQEEVNTHPGGVPLSRYRENSLSGTTEETIALILDPDGDKKLRVYEGSESDPFARGWGWLFGSDTGKVDSFNLLKEGGNLTWVEDPTDIPVCGLYKTQHHVCVNMTKRNMVVRFSLHLEDKHPPEKISEGEVCAENGGTFVFAVFPPAPADDVSYYELSCVIKDITPVNLNDVVRLNGRDLDGNKISTELSAVLQTCTGTPITPLFLAQKRQITLKIASYDISGLRGDVLEFEIKPKSDSESSIWDSIMGGIVGEGYTDYMSLIVGGGLTPALLAQGMKDYYAQPTETREAIDCGVTGQTP